MISVRGSYGDAEPAVHAAATQLAPYAVAAQRKLDAIRDYVCACAADELDPNTILEIIDTDYPHDGSLG